MNASSTRTAVVPLLLIAVALAGCGGGRRRDRSGCKWDNECKGTRVCIAGECQEPTKPDPVVGTPQRPPVATPQQHPVPPAQDPNAMAADGLPVFIPPPGSAPPTVAEWAMVTREITVAGSSALNCETKMLREWLRVTCRTRGLDVPINVRSDYTEGQQVYVYKQAGLASAVVQVVRGRSSRTTYVWDRRGRSWGRELRVSWPSQLPRPTIQL